MRFPRASGARHPSGAALGAWFDNELEVLAEGRWTAERVASHLPDCQRCQIRLHEMRTVRAAMRGETPPPSPAPAAVRRGAPAGWRYPSLAPLVAGVALIIGGLVAAGPGRPVVHNFAKTFFPIDEQPPSSEAPSRAAPKKAEQPAATTTTSTIAVSLPTVLPGITEPTTGTVAPPPSSTTVPLPPFRLGVVVPTSGPFAKESADVVKAVQAAAIAANGSGGVLGRRVEVFAVAAENTAGVASLPSKADVVVGGFGASVTNMPWLVPADAGIFGVNVIAGEVTPKDAGERLGKDLVARGVTENVGVVKGDGSDAELADGLAGSVKITSVTAAKDTDCENEVADLRKASADTLAIAGPPTLAAKCVQAAEKAGWKPAGGVLLAPDTAFWHIDIVAAAQGARTVLGFPWPTSDTPGVKRFRAAMKNSTSYRALESFAGAELAIAVARQNGGARGLSVADVGRGTWKSDLLNFEGPINKGAGVAVLGTTGWTRPA